MALKKITDIDDIREESAVDDDRFDGVTQSDEVLT